MASGGYGIRGRGGSRPDRVSASTRSTEANPEMTVRIGDLVFDHVVYDAEGDVLYMSIGKPRPAADGDASPEGHAIRYGQDGEVIGITLVDAKWLLERDGKITVTLPPAVDASVEDLAPILQPADAA